MEKVDFFRYICGNCGEAFKINNEKHDSSVFFCPYCGVNRDDMCDDAFDGIFIFAREDD